MIKRIVLNFVLAQQLLSIFAHPELQDCEKLDNGQYSNNPIFKEPSCTSECFVCHPETCENSEGSECPISACSKHEEKCNVDGYVGSYVMIENESQRIWNFTLEPGTVYTLMFRSSHFSFLVFGHFWQQSYENIM